ncbi:MAG: hypothetical protein KKA76_02640, partial [Proteobacteria bacterium]|nr:hypothetical protein [Pseudomonadota bacterium]
GEQRWSNDWINALRAVSGCIQPHTLYRQLGQTDSERVVEEITTMPGHHVTRDKESNQGRTDFQSVLSKIKTLAVSKKE